MVTHSSILVWKILGTEELGRLPSMRLQRVEHDWATEHARYIKFLRIRFFTNWAIREARFVTL